MEKVFIIGKFLCFFVVFLTAYEEENEGNFLVLIEKGRWCEASGRDEKMRKI